MTKFEKCVCKIGQAARDVRVKIGFIEMVYYANFGKDPLRQAFAQWAIEHWDEFED